MRASRRENTNERRRTRKKEPSLIAVESFFFFFFNLCVRVCVTLCPSCVCISVGGGSVYLSPPLQFSA